LNTFFITSCVTDRIDTIQYWSIRRKAPTGRPWWHVIVCHLWHNSRVKIHHLSNKIECLQLYINRKWRKQLQARFKPTESMNHLATTTYFTKQHVKINPLQFSHKNVNSIVELIAEKIKKNFLSYTRINYEKHSDYMHLQKEIWLNHFFITSFIRVLRDVGRTSSKSHNGIARGRRFIYNHVLMTEYPL